MPTNIETAIQLKQKLVDFVYDSEGYLAIALETYAAQKATRNSYGIKQQNLNVDLFVSDGKVGDRTPIDLFLEENSDLDPEEVRVIRQWNDNFIGLFEVKSIQGDRFEMMNWLTAKTYKVRSHSGISDKEKSRWQPGEIILTILAPLDDTEWFFFSDRVIKGRLSQPKLAVAVGEFRDNYPDFLYADAPEKLEQAWESVAVYHREFVNYFGDDNLTLPGYKLNQKIGELQQQMSDKKLAEAGLDSDKSLSEILSESGTDEAEFSETAADLGVDTQTVDKIIANKDKLSMVTPKVDLPPEIKQAENVTVFSHPKWGQMFLPNFNNFTDLLAASDWNNPEVKTKGLALANKYLEQSEANYYVWQQLKQKYPEALTTLLQEYTEKNDFNLDENLNDLLLKYNKISTPELPVIASVPLHLNNLFESAVAQVQKNKSKGKKKKKQKGFLR